MVERADDAAERAVRFPLVGVSDVVGRGDEMLRDMLLGKRIDVRADVAGRVVVDWRDVAPDLLMLVVRDVIDLSVVVFDVVRLSLFFCKERVVDFSSRTAASAMLMPSINAVIKYAIFFIRILCR